MAENTTLRDTLKAISASTGAEVQFPTASLQDHVFVHLGPGTPQEVVTQLLKGTQFNYVILSSDSEPSRMTRLILTKNVASSNNDLSAAPAALGDGGPTSALYGGGFTADADAAAPDATTADPQPTAAPNWVHHDGAVLSGEQLDQMQKSQIQQEQQQFTQQLQQKRQQEQADQNSPSQ